MNTITNYESTSKRAFAYVRANPDVDIFKYSISIQEDEIKKYCKVNNISIEKIFTDRTGAESISERTGLLDLLDAIGEDENQIDTVIVYETSRLWRSEETHILVARELMKWKIRLISVRQPEFDLYSKDPTATLFNAIIAALDEYTEMTINIRGTKEN